MNTYKDKLALVTGASTGIGMLLQKNLPKEEQT